MTREKVVAYSNKRLLSPLNTSMEDVQMILDYIFYREHRLVPEQEIVQALSRRPASVQTRLLDNTQSWLHNHFDIKVRAGKKAMLNDGGSMREYYRVNEYY